MGAQKYQMKLLLFLFLTVWCTDPETETAKPEVTPEVDDDREPEDNIEHVDGIDELQTMINSNKYLLAYFFHPSCIPCMEYVPRFDELPEEMAELDWASEVEFVKINMNGNEAAIREKYGVRGYP